MAPSGESTSNQQQYISTLNLWYSSQTAGAAAQQHPRGYAKYSCKILRIYEYFVHLDMVQQYLY